MNSLLYYKERAMPKRKIADREYLDLTKDVDIVTLKNVKTFSLEGPGEQEAFSLLMMQ